MLFGLVFDDAPEREIPLGVLGAGVDISDHGDEFTATCHEIRPCGSKQNNLHLLFPVGHRPAVQRPGLRNKIARPEAGVRKDSRRKWNEIVFVLTFSGGFSATTRRR